METEATTLYGYQGLIHQQDPDLYVHNVTVTSSIKQTLLETVSTVPSTLASADHCQLPLVHLP